MIAQIIYFWLRNFYHSIYQNTYFRYFKLLFVHRAVFFYPRKNKLSNVEATHTFWTAFESTDITIIAALSGR